MLMYRQALAQKVGVIPIPEKLSRATRGISESWLVWVPKVTSAVLAGCLCYLIFALLMLILPFAHLTSPESTSLMLTPREPASSTDVIIDAHLFGAAPRAITSPPPAAFLITQKPSLIKIVGILLGSDPKTSRVLAVVDGHPRVARVGELFPDKSRVIAIQEQTVTIERNGVRRDMPLTMWSKHSASVTRNGQATRIRMASDDLPEALPDSGVGDPQVAARLAELRQMSLPHRPIHVAPTDVRLPKRSNSKKKSKLTALGRP